MISYEEFKRIRVEHTPALYVEEHRFTSYKNISIHLAMREVCIDGDWAQFGVFRGQTARILESYILPGRMLHLFDSFEGLPEDWTGTSFAKGSFAMAPSDVPCFDPSRSRVYRGWFDETVPEFAANHRDPLSLLHLDADLYSSTTTVLNAMNRLIVPGTILLFDELFLPTDKGLADDECRALWDWSSSMNRAFQILWRTEWVQCAVKVIR